MIAAPTLAASLTIATVLLGGCSQSTAAPEIAVAPAIPVAPVPVEDPVPVPTPAVTPGAQPRLATEPAKIADDLVADELALRDPSTPEPALVAAARRQQAAYRAIGRNPDWDATIRGRIPADLMFAYDRNVDARRQLNAMAPPRPDTLPPWRIVAPAPAEELLGYYREAEAITGVGWNYLAAINLIETRLGSIAGVSSAGAQGPMQFMPPTWAAYGRGDVNAPRDAIMAAGRYLADSGFATNRDRALFAYNNAYAYVRAVSDYAAVLGADPAAFAGYYRWDVYYYTTAGEVLLPIGFAESTRIPVADYLATHPQ
ncbi:MAG: transglycosylase SLT domain-containing protein [Mycobacterium sp.]